MLELTKSLSLVALIVSTHCLLLAVVLYTSYSGHRRANGVLALLLFVEAVRLFALTIVSESKIYDSYLINQLVLLRLTYGPLLLLYTKTITQSSSVHRYRELLHIVPYLVVGLAAYVNRQLGYVISVDQQAIVVGFVILASFIAYGQVCINKVRLHRQNIQHQLSAIESVSLSWIRLLAYYLMAIVLVYCVIALSHFFSPYTIDQLLTASLASGAIFCYLFAFLGLRQRPIGETISILQPASHEAYGLQRSSPVQEQGEAISPIKARTTESEPVKYSSSDLSEEDAEYYFKKLLELMDTQKLYLINGLKIQQIGEEMGLHVPQLSRVINQCSGMNFYDFVNNYRVTAARSLLQSSQQKKPSMIIVAEQVGFNSTSTFYKHFKKVTGKTPKQYVRELAV